MKNTATILYLCLAALLTPLAGTIGRAEDKPAVAVPAAVYTVEETAEFKKLTKATIEALDAGKKEKMIAKLTDLETAWDDKEDKLKPKDAATWMLIDKTLDKAISSLRSSKTDLPKGKATLEDLLKKLKLATKEPAHA